MSSRVITLIAPIKAFMKVFPMTTHIKVIALIPFNTFNSGYLSLFIYFHVYWIANPLCHPFPLFLTEATKTRRIDRIIRNRVKKNVQS